MWRALAWGCCSWAAAVGWTLHPAHGAELCPPAATVAGDAHRVAPVRRSLAERGISQVGTPGCPRLEVAIARASAGFDLHITDADGRTSRRRLRSAEAAATLIESWARTELSDPLLPLRQPREDPAATATATMNATTTTPASGSAPEEAPAAPAAPAPAPAPAPALREPPILAAAPSSLPAPRGRSRVLIGLAPETSLSADRFLSMGAGAGLCLRAGPLCAGLTGRFAHSVAIANDRGATWTRFRTYDVLATLEAPLPLGPVRVIPGLGLGLGRSEGHWRAPSRDDDDRYRRDGGRTDGPPHDRMGPRPDQPGPATPPPAGAVTADALRATAGIGVLVPIAASFSLEVVLSGTASVQPLRTQRTGSNGEGGAARGPSALPEHQLRAGLGVRYGRP
jgi:hypothetical protein